MFQQALAPAEADAEVDRWAIPCREGRPAAEQTLKLAALGSPHGQLSGRFFAAMLEQALPY
jgi:hypothetical protein